VTALQIFKRCQQQRLNFFNAVADSASKFLLLLPTVINKIIFLTEQNQF
jgi:hypothetical protein